MWSTRAFARCCTRRAVAGFFLRCERDDWYDEPSDVRFKSLATTAIRADIQAKLTSIGSTLTVDNILDRATTQTCGGCHRQSNNVVLGGGLTWPASNAFTHISRNGTLSPALTNVFLPRRKQVLEEFINRRLEGAENVGFVCH